MGSVTEDLKEAVLKPTKDWIKLLIGGILYAIPILDIIALGYAMKNVREPKDLPEFEFGQDFMLGLKGIVVTVAYLLIPFVLMKMGGILKTLGVVLFIAAVFPLVRALIALAKTNNFGSAFEFQKIMEEAYTGKTLEIIGGMIAIGIVYGVISTVLLIIPLIGFLLMPFAMFASIVASWSYAGSRI